MSTTDLYTEDFPHGTPKGYELGCRGAACPNQQSTELTCRQAHMKYQGDYAYRKAIDAGETWVEPVVVKAPVPAAKPKPAPVAPKPAASAVSARSGRLKVGVDDVGFPHGTPNGYARGCKKPVVCPAEVSCTDANRAYQNAWHAAKVAKEAAAVVVVTPESAAVSPDAVAAFDAASRELAVWNAAEDAFAVAQETEVELQVEPAAIDDAAAAVILNSPTPVEVTHDAPALAATPSLRIDQTPSGGVNISIDPDAPPMFIVVRFDVHGLAEARVTTGIAQAAA